MGIDWERALEINRQALARIVVGLVSALAAHGAAARLPLPAYQAIIRILFPAESALRRLIVIAARGLVVTLPARRPMPKGQVIERKNTRTVFCLFDTRKHFGDAEESVIVGPRIRTIDSQSPRAQFLAKFAKPNEGGEAGMLRVRNRVVALKQALETLPRQAQRMARWRARRAMLESPMFTSPLRPGRPPGHRKKPREDIDKVLIECHALAWDVLHYNSS